MFLLKLIFISGVLTTPLSSVSKFSASCMHGCFVQVVCECMYGCGEVYMHVSVCASTCMCLVSVCVHKWVDVSISTCECVWKCMCVQVRVYGDGCACACAGLYVHMSVYGCVGV